MPMASGHLTLTLWPMLGTDTAEPSPDTGTDMALGTTAKGPLMPGPSAILLLKSIFSFEYCCAPQ